MESFLNILWVAIALGALAVWRLRWVRERDCARRDSLQEWTAFGCVIVLLFFAVSMSDDLHSEIVVLEESFSTRRHALVLTSFHHTAPDAKTPVFSFVAVLPARVSFDPIAINSLMFPANNEPFLGVSRDASRGRSPPSTFF